MDDGTLIRDIRSRLFDEKGKVWLAPIRHHSPACSAALAAMIREIRPTQILIEGPEDYTRLIPDLLHPETQPPVAIAALVEHKDRPRIAAYFPLCAHSPEFVALKEGKAIGAELAFFDLSSDRFGAEDAPDLQPHPRAIQDEVAFDSGDYVRRLAEKLGCRDGFELWDHLFETRIGTPDWRAFFADVGSYCAGLRATSPSAEVMDGINARREAHMARGLQRAAGKGPVIAVIGGFHAAGLLSDPSGPEERGKPESTSRSYLIRYGYREMDALMGYGAGLPQPAWYERLWQAHLAQPDKMDWQGVAQDVVGAFVGEMRAKGITIAVPQQVELLRSAQLLSQLRARPGAMRHDLIDALRSSLLKGEAGSLDVWSERFLTFLQGHRLGQVPESAGQPPLVADAFARARAAGFDVTDGRRRTRALDIRRKPAHLAASRFAHAMSLLDTTFVQHEGGPDLITGAQLTLLIEHWLYAWSPQVEAKLIEASIHGDTLPAACLGALLAARADLQAEGRGGEVLPLVILIKRGLLAGLGAEISPLIDELVRGLQVSARIDDTARALQDLAVLHKARGPLSLPNVLDPAPLFQAAYLRTVYLCGDLEKTGPESLGDALTALRLISDLLRDDIGEGLDAALFDAAMVRLEQVGPPPELLGAALAIRIQNGYLRSERLAEAVRGQFAGSHLETADQIRILTGVMKVAPALLWTEPQILTAVDDFLTNVSETDFFNLLPGLRLVFTELSPRETDRLAESLTEIAGGRAADFAARTAQVSQSEADIGRVFEQEFRATLEHDGLADWFDGALTESRMP